MSELERLAGTGFSSTAIEAAVNTIEFSLRENNTGSFPRGLSLMLRSMSSWIYDKDPFQPLQWKQDLQRFKVHYTCLDLCSSHASGLRAVKLDAALHVVLDLRQRPLPAPAVEAGPPALQGRMISFESQQR